MTWWEEFAAAEPELARRVTECFAVRKHATMATLRRDGSPRISGTEVELGSDGVFLGSMPRAMKALDLLRDPRVSIHSPTVDPPEHDPSAWPGEAKVAGRAVEVPVPPPPGRGASPGEGAHRFRLALDEVVHTRVDGDQLEITSWHPGRGVEVHRRT